MYPSLLFVVEIDRARRREAVRQAAQWQLLRLLPSRDAMNKPPPGPWQWIALLARARDRRIVRARLREYVAR
jgi:hypothetical protein